MTTSTETFLPVYDVSDGVAVVVEADAATTWDALLDADLIEVGKRRPGVAALGALRALPDLVAGAVRGRKPPAPSKRMRLRDLPELTASEGGWTLLAEHPRRELALGLVGKFWKPVIEYAEIADADAFAAFSRPGYAKTVYQLSLRPLHDHRTLLEGVMRTATTDAHARRWFARYWTLGVGSGAHVLVRGLLDCVREDAERRANGHSPDGA